MVILLSLKWEINQGQFGINKFVAYIWLSELVSKGKKRWLDRE